MYDMPDIVTHLLPIVERQLSEWFEALSSRPVTASITAAELRRRLGGPLRSEGDGAELVLESLGRVGQAGTVASTGPRYFGFVIGGNLPAALAADWLVSTWDQNSTLYAMSPLVSAVEQITGEWLLDLAGLPATMSFGFVTGCQMANFTALAAARHRVLENAGWNVEADGLFGAPPVDVVMSEEAHYTIAMALRLLGLGANRVHKISTDTQGRMRAADVSQLLRGRRGTAPCIVCAQVGNVNTGAADPVAEIAALARESNAWLHVDGAFGLWAAASPAHRHLIEGVNLAHSIATDAHKWLNVPYDCGLVFCADEQAHRSAMSLAAAYIPETKDERDPHEFVPEASRRARAIPVYAALRSLGRNGVCKMVERHCRQARRFAEALHSAGYKVLNDVVLNQVLVSFGTAEQTQNTIAAIQQEGTCWCGGTVWKGQTAMRISVSNWRTTDEDVEKSIAAILRLAPRRQ